MTRIKQSDIISDLHYALTESQCKKCGSPLKWKTNFSDVNQPKYFSSHCNQDFVISIASVRIEAQKLDKNENNPKIFNKPKDIKYEEKNEKATGRTRKVSVMLRKKEIEPRATALRKEHRQGKERQKTHKNPGNSLCFQARGTETSSSSLVPQGQKCNANDPDDKDNEETKHQTRELILPSDSNVVKGNV
jgi:hypothetical protein